MSGAINQRSVSQFMRGASQEHMVRRRDATGDEMTTLAGIMNDPNPNPDKVTSYIRDMMQKDHIPADEAKRLLATVPHDPEALRAWAKEAFSLVMQQGIHAHAAFPRSIYPSQQQQAPQQPPPQAPADPAAAPPMNQ